MRTLRGDASPNPGCWHRPLAPFESLSRPWRAIHGRTMFVADIDGRHAKAFGIGGTVTLDDDTIETEEHARRSDLCADPFFSLEAALGTPRGPAYSPGLRVSRPFRGSAALRIVGELARLFPPPP